MRHLAEAPNEEMAAEALHRAELTDGLPVVIPTERRVSDMLLMSGFEGDEMLGIAGPSQSSVTAEGAAICAVMAGCLPQHFPVVVAAVRAVCDPRFDLTEVQVTTHPLSPLLIVNGPVRHEAGLASAYGAFGYGHRANAAIGRAVRLVLIAFGGGWPGRSDMAVFGHPAKLTFCVAENEEASPFEPLHVARGHQPDQGTVTAVAVEGPHSVVCAPAPAGSGLRTSDAYLNVIASAVGAPSANSTYHDAGTIVVMLGPTIAHTLADAGHDRSSIQNELVQRSRHRRSVLRRLNPGLIAEGPDDDLVPERDPATILLLVAGGEGNYAMVCPTLGVGAHRNAAVTAPVENNLFCELPPTDPSA